MRENHELYYKSRENEMNVNLGKNQFLFSKEDTFEGYDRKIAIGEYWLYLGLDCHYYTDDNGIHILGYAIDVLHPQYTLKEMCFELKKAMSKNVLGPELTRTWNGRFVIFLNSNEGLVVWNDCCGLKQVFRDTSDPFVFASQARYIAALKEYEKDSEAEEYLELAKKKDKEYSLILDRTLYCSIRRLLPNHYIKNGKELRADLCIKNGSSSFAAELIRNSLDGIGGLGSIAVTLTAGWDSRLVLSGVDNRSDSVLVTLKYDWMDELNQDIVVASELAKEKGIQHKVVNCDRKDQSFIDEYMAHSENGHEYWIQMAQATRDGGFANSYWVKGSCNEIIRNSFGVLYNWQVNEKILCKLYSLPTVPFVKDAIQSWLGTSREFCKKNNISLLDLFYWEQRMGSWLAECLNEADVVGETFTPFNSRVYIENGLAIDINKRIAPDYAFFKEILDINTTSSLTINKDRYRTAKSRFFICIKTRAPIIYGLYLRCGQRWKKR